MSPARHLPKRDYDALKAAFRALVQLVGGTRAAERITRVSHQQIDRYGSTHTDFVDVFAPMDVVADLEAECGQQVVTRKLAEMADHVLIPLPAVTGSSARIDVITARTVQSFGQMLTELGEARADGQIDAEEARKLDPQFSELITKLVKMRREVAQMAEGEDLP
jgi:hypothetical protein|tara:strand:- start:63655 stop:64146 length:492 start_codon:yes stop_codon:yes gene_type:complete